MNKYDDLARSIVEMVGGKDNVSGLTHCITRLRFILKDESKAQTEKLKSTAGVVTVMQVQGLYQVVIGQHVGEVYEAVLSAGGLSHLAEKAEAEQKKKESPIAAFMSVISGVFIPIIGVLCATGMIKGILLTCTYFNWLSESSGVYVLFYNAADSLFYFLPIMLGYTASKKFGLTETTGIMLGFALCVPALTTLAPSSVEVALGTAAPPIGTVLGVDYWFTFAGIPVLMPSAGNYTSSVIPIILIILFAARLERWVKTWVPSVIKMFTVPLVVLAVSVPLGYLLIGPAAAFLTELVTSGLSRLFALSPAIAGLLLGGFWQVLVIFGLHWGITPIGLAQMASMKYSSLLAPYYGGTWAQTGAVLAVMLKTKDKAEKSLCVPAIISGIVGITEPAIYGITLPKKTPFIASCIGAAAGGFIIAVTNTRYYAMAIGIFAFPTFIPSAEYLALTGEASSLHSLIWALIASAVSVGLGFVLTLILWKEKAPVQAAAASDTADSAAAASGQAETGVFTAPLSGRLVPLSEVEDEAFSSGVLGSGLAIDPSEGKVYAPCDGIISVTPDTAHAVGMTSHSGAEILIHVGMNTVELKGEGFTLHVKEEQRVKRGDLLLSFDIDLIKKSGRPVLTPMVIANAADIGVIDIRKTYGEHINHGEDLMELIPN